MFKIAAVALTAALTALILKKSSPEFSILAVIAGGVIISAYTLASIDGILDYMLNMEGYNEIKGVLAAVLKAVGIVTVSNITACLCHDAEQSALAAKVELAGNIGVIALSLPLIKDILEMICEMF